MDRKKDIVRFQNVGMRYGLGPEIFHDVSFGVKAGSFRFVIGASGAGKSTLLKLMYLAHRPSRGLIHMFGKDTASVARKDMPAMRRRIGVVFQDFRLIDHLSALDNVALPLRVFAHNVECVPRLDSVVRDPRASFDQSLQVLTEAKRLRPDLLIKTSIMVGLGESDEEVVEAMQRLRGAGVDMITLGQYLQPSYKHLTVDRFPEPGKFADWDRMARNLGFKAVASGPLVRSSYRAGLLWEEAVGGEPVVTRESAGSAVSHLIGSDFQVKAQSQMS